MLLLCSVRLCFVLMYPAWPGLRRLSPAFTILILTICEWRPCPRTTCHVATHHPPLIPCPSCISPPHAPQDAPSSLAPTPRLQSVASFGRMSVVSWGDEQLLRTAAAGGRGRPSASGLPGRSQGQSGDSSLPVSPRQPRYLTALLHSNSLRRRQAAAGAAAPQAHAHSAPGSPTGTAEGRSVVWEAVWPACIVSRGAHGRSLRRTQYWFFYNSVTAVCLLTHARTLVGACQALQRPTPTCMFASVLCLCCDDVVLRLSRQQIVSWIGRQRFSHCTSTGPGAFRRGKLGQGPAARSAAVVAPWAAPFCNGRRVAGGQLRHPLRRCLCCTSCRSVQTAVAQGPRCACHGSASTTACSAVDRCLFH